MSAAVAADNLTYQQRRSPPVPQSHGHRAPPPSPQQQHQQQPYAQLKYTPLSVDVDVEGGLHRKKAKLSRRKTNMVAVAAAVFLIAASLVYMTTSNIDKEEQDETHALDNRGNG